MSLIERPVLRVALYGRFSTDKQKETSITDQMSVCERFAQGLTDNEVVARYSDESISGSTRVETRAGGRRLMADAMADRFDVLVVEALDRLSRDQVEQETIIRRLEYRGIRVMGVADGYDSTSSSRKVQRAVRGLVNELYIDDLRCKTIRGQTGQVERGFIAGGKSYGYDVVRTERGSDYQVNREEAAIVRFIFEKFAAGWSTLQICDDLNGRNIPSPRGGTWMRSAIYGSPNKGSGILNNSAYIGEYIWNRSQWLKDPDSGKRVRENRPPSEWKTEQRAHYRMLPDELWFAVRARMGTDRLNSGTKGRSAPPRTLFAGVLRCAHCGGALTSINQRNYGCVTRKERGKHACEGISVLREQTDERLLGVLRDELCSEAAQADIDAVVRRYFGSDDTEREAAKLAKSKIDTLTKEMENLSQAIAELGMSAALIERFKRTEAEREALQQVLAKRKIGSDQYADIAQRVRRKTAELGKVLAGSTGEARQIIATLFGPIIVEKRDEAYYASFDDVSERLVATVTGNVSIRMVAGVGFEPTTFGL